MGPRAQAVRQQLAWAARVGLNADSKGYLPTVESNLFRPLKSEARQAFEAGSGSELRGSGRRPPKLHALHSSAALAVNFFERWTDGLPHALCRVFGVEGRATRLRFEAQLDTALGGTPPHLDVLVSCADGRVIGVESKFTEWMSTRSASQQPFKEKYFPADVDLWVRAGMPRAQALAEAMRQGSQAFRHLDAAQLLKHCLGLAAKHPGCWSLHYVYLDWPCDASAVHRAELDAFESRIDSCVGFRHSTYQSLFAQVRDAAGPDDLPYLDWLRDRYFAAADGVRAAGA